MHPTFDTPPTGAHAAAWHALEPGATCSLPAPPPHYDEPNTWTIHRNNQGCT
jgi:hypothetical protein